VEDAGVALAATLADGPASAQSAGLRYISDQRPGFRRLKRGTGFVYVDVDGRKIRDAATLSRIKALVIPPAWTAVWIAPSANAHIQATGRDARGRKQYRYHAHWRAMRDETKYNRMVAFAKVLTAIRQRTEADLREPGLTRSKVVAAIVQLLEKTLIRVGNEEYARTNRSFGLTTMRDGHVEVTGQELRFEFVGKSGVRQSVTLEDRRLARIVKRCQDVPGQELFQYVDDDGQRRSVDSADINEYLRAAAGADFTAKDFRTWAGTILAARALQEFRKLTSNAEAKRNIVRAIESVAGRLGNTKAVCRKCYIHPAILDAYLDGSLMQTLRRRARRALETTSTLSAEETAVLTLLERRLGQESRKRRPAA
jgi:DNA topoisomerase-1